jgi:hypothetical protein
MRKVSPCHCDSDPAIPQRNTVSCAPKGHRENAGAGVSLIDISAALSTIAIERAYADETCSISVFALRGYHSAISSRSRRDMRALPSPAWLSPGLTSELHKDNDGNGTNPGH